MSRASDERTDAHSQARMCAQLTLRQIALALALLGACYGGGDPEGDEAPLRDLTALTSAPEGGAGSALEPSTNPATEDAEEAEFVADLMHELDALYAQPAEARARAGEDVELGTDELEFAEMLAQQLAAEDRDGAVAPGSAPPAAAQHGSERAPDAGAPATDD